MCLAKPLRVSRIEDEIAWVSEDNRERSVSLLGVDGVAPGDYVLIHAGIALARLEPAEAEEILTVLDEVAAVNTVEEVSR